MPAQITDPQIASLIKESKDALAKVQRGSPASQKKKAIARLQQLGLLDKRGHLLAAFR